MKDEKAKQNEPVKSYKAPKLNVYGGMAKLTAGGSGAVTEANAGNNSKNNSKS